MTDGPFLALAHNASLLLGMALLCDMAPARPGKGWMELRQTVAGLLVGISGMALMLTPWTFEPGIVFDTRSVLLGTAGLFLGLIPTAMAMAMMAVLRLWQGGVAAQAGVGVIFASGLIGVAWRHCRRRPLAEASWQELYLLGLIINVVMLAMMLTLPRETAWRVLRTISLPVLTIYPVGTAALGMLMAHRFERRRTATALYENEQSIRATLYGIGDGVISTDGVGRIARMNPTAESLTGWAESEAIGRPLKDVFAIIDEQTRMEVANPVDRVLREGAVVGLANHTLLVSRDGTEHPIADSAAPIRDEDGQVTGVVLVLRDQTAERAAQRVLREKEELFSRVFRSAPVAIVIAYPGDGRIFDANEMYVATLGYSREELIGRTSLELNMWPFPEERARSIAMLRAEGRVQQFETHLRRKSGEIRDALSSLELIELHGEEFVLAMVSDITARKQAERALASAKEAADQANRSKDEFLARLSHELRTPLTPVLLATAQWEAHPDIPSAMMGDLAMVRRNLELEARLLDDLLDVNRIVSGKMVLRRDVIDVHQEIGNSLETVGADAEAKRLELTVRLQARQARMDGDPARVQQAIWNLLNNAIKFTPEGGSITLSTENDVEGRILVRVADSGIGIRPDLLPRLFKPFEQGGAQTTHGYGGLGLGLAICKSVAEMHGGSVAAYSDGPGRGATFLLKLPTVSLPRASKVRRADVGPAPTSGHAARILLVEDHVDTARLLARVLRVSGYEVRVAHNVASALEAAAEPFDLLVSDLGLPDGNGHDLMRQLSAGGRIKGIAVSGYGMEDDQQRSQEAGFLFHLTKPVNLAELRSTIRKALDGQ